MLIAKKPVKKMTLLRVSQTPSFDGVFDVYLDGKTFEVEINDNISINDPHTETEGNLIKTIIQYFLDKRGY